MIAAGRDSRAREPIETAVDRTDLAAPERHYDAVVRGFRSGRVTPVLGAGASICGRPNPCPEEALGRYPPTSQELAAHLANEFKYPPGETAELLRVSQYVYAMRGGAGPLYDALHELFDTDYAPTALHDFLAEVPVALRERGMLRKPPVIVTTNFDDLVERALVARNEEFDLVVYMAEGPHAGEFWHRPPGGGLEPIGDPETNVAIDPDQRTVVLKIHGFVDREYGRDDSYVITEDHYIDYLTRIDLDRLIPVKVIQRLRNCHLLFLGYSLRDWNLRAILSRLYAERLKAWDWWAVQVAVDPLERESWDRRDVRIYDQPLLEYVDALRGHFLKELEG